MATKVIKSRCMLRYWLKKKRWDYAELSRETGIPKSQISQYIHNERGMSLDNAATIAHILGISIEDLYEWELIKK